MFMSAGLIYAALGHDRIAGLAGIGRALPMSVIAFALAGVALIGVPPSGAYLAKELLLQAASGTGQWWWAVAIQAGGILTSSYVVLVLAHALAPADEPVTPRARIARMGEAAALALALCSLLLGLIPWQAYLPVPPGVAATPTVLQALSSTLWPLLAGGVLAILLGRWDDRFARISSGKVVDRDGERGPMRGTCLWQRGSSASTACCGNGRRRACACWCWRSRSPRRCWQGVDRPNGIAATWQPGSDKMRGQSDAGAGSSYVSTGQLPSPDRVAALVAEAHARYRTDSEGENSQVYPALARVPSALFGICVASTGGSIYAAGDADYEFSIMSVSKPFMFALVCQVLGAEQVRERLGVNATGMPFNSLAAIERGPDGRTNPMVNAGAIATTSLVPGATDDDKWQFIHEGLSQFAGRKLTLNEDVYASALDANFRNRAIAQLLRSYDRVYCDPEQAVDLYTRQSSLNVSAKDLAVMGATLADGGVNPLTRQRVVEPGICHHALAVMTTAGLYETSGDWLYDIGLPGKSGIGGGIVTVSPGKGGLGTFAPPLDSAGNSVKGQFVAKFLSQQLGMGLFVSRPES